MPLTLTQLIISVVALVVTNLVAVAAIAYYMTSTLGKRIDGLDKRIDDLNVNMNARFEDMNATINARFSDMSRQIDTRIGDLRNQMQREHDHLSGKVDTLTDTVTAHISNQHIHQPPRV